MPTVPISPRRPFRERPSSARRRIVIVSSDIGSGHRTPVELIASELRSSADLELIDGVRAMGRLLTLGIRQNSWVLFNWAPWLFELQYLLAARFAPTRWLAMRAGYLLGARTLLREVRRRDPDLVISTYPGATAVLGELRRRGLIRVPVVSVITDVAGLHYWAHPGVDLHLVANRESLSEVERIAAQGSVRCIRPPIPRESLTRVPREAARRRLGLPASGRVIAVSGGGWGVGDLAGAVEVALELEPVAVLCLTGRNERVRRSLERRFAGEPRVRVLGFTDLMSAVMSAADALVHSTGGVTALEARLLGCPVISYGFNFGHIKLTNRAFRRFGLAQVATDRDELRRELASAMGASRTPFRSSFPSLTELALKAEPTIRPLGRGVLWTRRILTGGATAVALMSGLLLTDDVYGVVADTLHVSALSMVKTSRRDVAILLDGPGAPAPRLVRELARDGIGASFALAGPPRAGVLAELRRHGDDAVARPRAGAPFGMFDTDLSNTARELRLRSHFLYEAGPGFTLGQYLVAREEGGSPIRGAARVALGAPRPNLMAGDIVAATLPAGRRRQSRLVASLHRQLHAARMRGVTVSALISQRSG